VTGTFALTPLWSASADEWAPWSVSAACEADCAWPEPPHPTMQDDALDWLWFAVWSVAAVFVADESAVLFSVWLAELDPAWTSPPATVTGTFALTPFWFASALDDASWIVAAFWETSCACPEPPHPAAQLELLDWCWPADWFVDAVFVADESAVLVLCWVAELEPPDTLPPAIVTGTFAFTPFWCASAFEDACWIVAAVWEASCACPEPPQPAAQLELLDWLWSADCVVAAVFAADDFAVFVFTWVAEPPPTETPLALTVTGTFAFTAFCWAFAAEVAACAVMEACDRAWAWPAPPQPA